MLLIPVLSFEAMHTLLWLSDTLGCMPCFFTP